MPRVHGQLSLVTEQPERITEAHVRAPETRASGSGVVTGSPDRVRVESGAFDAVLAPGPCVVTLVSLGVPVQHLRLIVPEGDVSLRAAFEAGLAADSGDRSVLERLAGEAAGALEAAEAATRAAGEAAEAAAGSASEAKQSATAAASSAAAAESHAKRAGSHANEAGAHASAAGESAKAADASATAAAGDADRAKQEADRATTQADKATESAGEAKGHADRAEGVVDTVRWDDDRLTVMGKTSPSLRGPRGQKGEPGGVRGFAIEGNGTDPQATGQQALALGWSAVGKNLYSAAVGYASQAGGSGSAAVGSDAQAGGDYSAAVGYASQAGGDYSAAVGSGAQAGGDYSAAVGSGAQATTTATTAIGPGHEITTPGETHIGVPKTITEALDVPSSRVVLHGTVEATEPPTRPEHLATKSMVDETRALVETRAVVKQVTSPPSSFEPGVLYVIPE